MRVSLAGNVISVYKNGTLLVTATDSHNATEIKHGLGANA
jgi:hypothetical protein